MVRNRIRHWPNLGSEEDVLEPSASLQFLYLCKQFIDVLWSFAEALRALFACAHLRIFPRAGRRRLSNDRGPICRSGAQAFRPLRPPALTQPRRLSARRPPRSALLSTPAVSPAALPAHRQTLRAPYSRPVSPIARLQSALTPARDSRRLLRLHTPHDATTKKRDESRCTSLAHALACAPSRYEPAFRQHVAAEFAYWCSGSKCT